MFVYVPIYTQVSKPNISFSSHSLPLSPSPECTKKHLITTKHCNICKNTLDINNNNNTREGEERLKYFKIQNYTLQSFHFIDIPKWKG